MARMTMHNPAHPGETIREDILAELGMTITEAADRLGVSRKTLSKVLNERGSVTSEMALRLEAVFGPSAESWLRQQAAYDLWQTRRAHRRLQVRPVDKQVT